MASSKSAKLIGVIREMFPANDKRSAQVLRLMISVNMLMSMQTMFCDIGKGEGEEGELSNTIYRGDRLVNVLLTVGILNEAMDTFRGLQGSIKENMKTPEAKIAYEEFCQSCDKKNPESLYCRIVTPLRSNTAFHLSQNTLQAVLEQQITTDQLETIFVSYDGGSRYSLADEILEKMVIERIKKPDTLDTIAEEIPKAYKQLRLIVAMFTAHWLKEKGAIWVG